MPLGKISTSWKLHCFFACAPGELSASEIFRNFRAPATLAALSRAQKCGHAPPQSRPAGPPPNNIRWHSPTRQLFRGRACQDVWPTSRNLALWLTRVGRVGQSWAPQGCSAKENESKLGASGEERNMLFVSPLFAPGLLPAVLQVGVRDGTPCVARSVKERPFIYPNKKLFFCESRRAESRPSLPPKRPKKNHQKFARETGVSCFFGNYGLIFTLSPCFRLPLSVGILSSQQFPKGFVAS